MGLGIDQTADRAQDRRVNRMGAAKARSNNRPILAPANAVLNPHPDLAQLSIEGVLFFGQLFPLRLLKGDLNLQARHLLGSPGLRVGQGHLADLLAEALIALVGLGLAPVGQALDGLEVIAQFFIMHLAGHGFTEGDNMMLAVRHELGLERKAFFSPNNALGAAPHRSGARRAARWRQ